jgi:hypothetical protein
MKPGMGILDFPDDPAAIASWLEKKLVGVELSRVVAELELVHGVSGVESQRRPSDPIGERWWSDVLKQGLGVLPRTVLSALLRQPRLLLDLQARVLLEGGPYWEKLNREDPAIARYVDTSKKNLATIFREVPPVQGSSTVPYQPRAADRKGRGLRLFAALATMAATIASGVWFVEHTEPTGRRPAAASPGEWGWSRPEAFAKAATPREYLERLADLASEWFKVRPVSDDPESFALRLGEFRAACTRLLMAKHESVTPDDRAWLLERCRRWSKSLDDIRDRIESADPRDRDTILRKAHADSDELVRKLTNALREQARVGTKLGGLPGPLPAVLSNPSLHAFWGPSRLVPFRELSDSAPFRAHFSPKHRETSEPLHSDFFARGLVGEAVDL